MSNDQRFDDDDGAGASAGDGDDAAAASPAGDGLDEEPTPVDEFASGEAPDSGPSADANDPDPFASGEGPDSGRFADANESDNHEQDDTDMNVMADTIDDEIHELAVERDQFKDIAQRLQADFENYRKRMASQIAAEIDRATGRMAEALLPVLDAAEAAYVQHPDEVGPLLNLMLAELRKQGLETIDLLDKPFDPNLADAVAHEPGDSGDIVVAEVLRSGYCWNGRTLRPAMVRTRD